MSNIILTLFAFALFGCGNDPSTAAGYFDDDIDKSVKDNSINGGAQSYNNYGGTMNVYNNNGTTAVALTNMNVVEAHTAQTAQTTAITFHDKLAYINVNKTSYNIKLVMQNMTAKYMSVTINTATTCTQNDGTTNTHIKTTSFTFVSFERVEEELYYLGSTANIQCTCEILSIVPTLHDESGFQAWTGNYTISIK